MPYRFARIGIMNYLLRNRIIINSLFAFMVFLSIVDLSMAMREDCTVGDSNTGYWVILDTGWDACKIPGEPDPSSAFLVSGHNSADRYEGKYWLNTSMGACGWGTSPPDDPECYNFCITGFAEWWCTRGGRNKVNGSVCEKPDGNKDGKPDGYATYPDGLRSILREWRCNYQQPPCSNCNQGPPQCPIDPSMNGGA